MTKMYKKSRGDKVIPNSKGQKESIRTNKRDKENQSFQEEIDKNPSQEKLI